MAKKPQSPPIQQTAIGDGNIQIVGDKNVVNQTFIQKIFNIFRTDAETTDQRNRRIMLGHVENFWVKGILEKSLHGAALLDLGIKEDPDALNYPWAIKREANKETLPAGTSMLEIFQEIGMGRSLLILGAPGSGKTTMLLELTRQLIERAREDVTEPIPVVFNLSSWTEKLTLADWLARELNVIYTIPKKTAPTWVKENKMLLLLDGLDEVRLESRNKCVDAINQFRKENGLTSMGVCSRIQDYAELKTRLSFDGAIEIQQLTSKQVDEYFKRFGEGLEGIRQLLERNAVLHEMAETPLFLSIMTLAYRDTETKDILVSKNLEVQRKHLFNTYIEHMFERPERSKNKRFKKQDILHWLSWLAHKMIDNNQVPYLLENMQPKWLRETKQVWWYKLMNGLLFMLILGLIGELSGELIGVLLLGLVFGLFFSMARRQSGGLIDTLENIQMIESWRLNWNKERQIIIIGLLIVWLSIGLILRLIVGWSEENILGLSVWMIFVLLIQLSVGLENRPIHQTTYPGQRINFSIKSFFFSFLIVALIAALIAALIVKLGVRLIIGMNGWLGLVLVIGLILALVVGMNFGGASVIQHYILRFILSLDNLLPFRLIPFLDYCVDLIFLRRVGGGYIFVHRLLMEHFAAMETATE